MPYADDEEELILIEKLDNLEALNGTRIVKHSLNKKAAPKAANAKMKLLDSKIKNLKVKPLLESFNGLTNNPYMQNYKSIFSYLKEFLDQEGELPDSMVEFEAFLKGLEIDFVETCKGKKEIYLKKTLLTMAKFSIHNFCYVKSLDYIKNKDSPSYIVLKTLHECLNNYLREYFQEVLELENMYSNKSSTEKEKAVINKTTEILETSEKLFQENLELTYELDELKSSYSIEIKTLYERMASLELENSNLIDKLIKQSKTLALSPIRSKSPAPTIPKLSIKATQSFSLGAVGGPSASMPLSPRFVSMQSLQLMITSLYSSKADYDKRCLASKSKPVLNLEAFLFKHLTTKFGLKSLVAEWADAIVTAVQKYAEESFDVMLFGKILQNRVDENFIKIKQSLESSVHEVLERIVRENNSKKCEAEIKEILFNVKQKMLSQEDALDVSSAVMQKEDLDKLWSYISKHNLICDGEISYKDLQNTILLYFLVKHERFLDRIREIFEGVDTDDDGFINSVEALQVLDYIDPSNELKLRKKEIVHLCDPRGLNSITFSMLVEVASSVEYIFNNKIRIRYRDEDCSLIQYLSL